MSLRPRPRGPVPAPTAQVAHAAFPKGHPSLTRRDHLGTLFQDADFPSLFPPWGSPGWPPWRLALGTLRPFREHLAARPAAEAVRARMDWQSLLGLDVTDPGCDVAVLSAFRARLLAGSAEGRRFDQLLERGRPMGWLKARGQQRTDSTPVLAALRGLHRLERVAETLRATRHARATGAPAWRHARAPRAWDERDGPRSEETRLPPGQANRAGYAQTVGEEGCAFRAALATSEGPAGGRALASGAARRHTWQRHAERLPAASPGEPAPARRVRFKENRDVPRAAEGREAPDEVAAPSRDTPGTSWTGYRVPVSATCAPTQPPLLTHGHTPSAAVHAASGPAVIQQALVDKDLVPTEHLVAGAYSAAELLRTSQQAHGMTLRGPTRPLQGWQTQVEGASTVEHVAVAWPHQPVVWPQGTPSRRGHALVARDGHPSRLVSCSPQQGRPCPARPVCTPSQQQGRRLRLPPHAQSEALQAARAWYRSAEGTQGYKRRAGVEGPLSQGVRACGLRRTRSRGLEKTHVQHVATAAAITIDRIGAWLEERPRATTRPARCAARAPVQDLPSAPPSV